MSGKQILSENEQFKVMEFRKLFTTLRPIFPSANVDCREMIIPITKKSSIPIQLFRPKNVKRAQPLPTLFYLPGTAYVVHNIYSSEVACSWITEKTGCQTIIIHCSLAPENKFPRQYEETCVLLSTILSSSKTINQLGIDKERIVLSGYSTGGHIAALVCADAHKHGIPISHQLLISPLIDCSSSHSFYKHYDKLFTKFDNPTPMLYEVRRKFIVETLMSHVDRTSPSISPIYHENCYLKKLPPTDIFYGEIDSARVDSEAYCKKLRNSGVKTKIFVFKNQDHGGFFFASTNKANATLCQQKMHNLNKVCGRLKFVWNTLKRLPY